MTARIFFMGLGLATFVLAGCGDDDRPAVDAGPLDDGGGMDATSGCPTGTAMCGSACVDTQSSRTNCGGCGNECATGEACVDGSCGVLCPSGQTDCAGACVDTTADRLHCGGCGMACGAGEACVDGACEISCPAGQMVCGASCVSVDSDPSHCGACGAACGAGEVCSEGACAFECSAGLTDCDSACVDTQNDPGNCGACGTACTAPTAATGLCTAGTCRVVCDALTGDCNGDLGMAGSDGCEQSLATDPANCGGCGFECSLANAAAGCAAGDCTVTACDDGFGDCDGVAANGCELDVTSDDINCGGCGITCAAGERCSASACVAAPGDQCSGAISLAAGANTVDWTAFSNDYLTTRPSCTSYSLDGPDIVLSYTAAADERVALEFEKPTSTRWVAVVSTEACGTVTPALDCVSEYSPSSMTAVFGLSAGETAYVYVADTSSGSDPLDNPLTVNLTTEDCSAAPSVTLDPPSGGTTASLTPTFTATFGTPVDTTMGVITITGDMGTSLSYDLSTAPDEVDFRLDDTVMVIDPGITFPQGESLTLGWTGLQSSLCATPVAIPSPTWMVQIIDPPCVPGTGGLVGTTLSMFSTGGFSSFSEYYVAADESPTGYVYVGGTGDLLRMRKSGGGVENVAALAGIDFDQLGYAMLIDGDDIYTLESDTSGTTEHLWRISTDGGATWTVEDYATFPTAPSDDFRGLTVYDGRIYLVTEEDTSGDPTEIWSVPAGATTLPVMATLEQTFTGEDCNAIARDNSYYYTACAQDDQLLRVPVGGGAAELMSDVVDLSFTTNVIYGHDTDADGAFDALYIHNDYEESYFLCGPAGTAPFYVGDHASHGTSTFGNYGLGFDEAANVLWMFDDDNQRFISVQ